MRERRNRRAEVARLSNGKHHDAGAGTGNGTHEVPTISVIVPTRNELANVEALVKRLTAALPPTAEVIFVDDSDDTTAYAIRRCAKADGYGGPKIRLVHRPFPMREGGLGTAVTQGLRIARGAWACVLDADLQHPPELIGEMLERGIADDVDLVVGSRYGDHGSDQGLSRSRRAMSRGCAVAAKAVLPRRLRGTSDPLSGFFLLRLDAIDIEKLKPNGFKILLEIMGRHPDLRVSEVGYCFSERYAGLSKASLKEARRYAAQLVSLTLPGRATTAVVQGPRPAHYDIHGIISVTSDYRLPELEKFRVQALAAPAEIQVRRLPQDDTRDFVDLDHAHPHVRYQERLGRAGFIVEVETADVTTAWVSALVAHSPHVLYTNVVEPILRWALVARGYALVHAACFARDGDAFMITARTDTGKTTTMLKIMDNGRYTFLSDDLTLVDPAGNVLTYPKPLTISHHTVHAIGGAELALHERMFLPLQSRLHSRAGRRFAFLIASKRFPVATLNAAVQWVVPPPKYHVERLVPGVRTGHTARLTRLFVIERADHESILPLSDDDTLDTFLANCEDAYGFPPYSSLEDMLRFQHGHDLRAREREILGAALNRPAVLVRSATMDWARSISDLLDANDVVDAREPVAVG